MRILSAKQVGPIYYMVSDIAVLSTIVAQGLIRTSTKVELSNKGTKKLHYISFMRDLTKAGRNLGRWKYGLKLDGDKLSERYSIEPFSYAGRTMNTSQSFFRIKTLTSYDDNTYKLNLVDWPAIDIPEYVFNELADLIESDPEGNNAAKNLEKTTGARPYRGKTIVTKYNYNTKNGGFKLTSKLLSPKCSNYLLKHTNMNETEERIWIVDDNVKYISISDCIEGYIAPRGDELVQDAIDARSLPTAPIYYF